MARRTVFRLLVIVVALVALPYACSSSSSDDAARDGDAGVEAGPDAQLCAALSKQAFDEIQAAVKAANAADAGCSTTADCTSVALGSCASSCYSGVSGGPAQVAILVAEEKRQTETLCPAFLDAGCVPSAPCPGSAAPARTCIADECRVLEVPTWRYFEFRDSTTDRIAFPDASVTATNPARNATLTREDYDVVEPILADASFPAHPTFGCDMPPADSGTIAFYTQTVNGNVGTIATGCVLGDAGNDIKTLYGVISKY